MKRDDKVIYRKALGNNQFREIRATIMRKSGNGYFIEQQDGRRVTVKADEIVPLPPTSSISSQEK